MTAAGETVTLNTPITIDGREVASIEVRKPMPRELSGVRLAILMAMDVDAIAAVLPRVTTPMLPEALVAEMDLTDFTALGVTLVGFLTPGRGALTM